MKLNLGKLTELGAVLPAEPVKVTINFKLENFETDSVDDITGEIYVKKMTVIEYEKVNRLTHEPVDKYLDTGALLSLIDKVNEKEQGDDFEPLTQAAIDELVKNLGNAAALVAACVRLDPDDEPEDPDAVDLDQFGLQRVSFGDALMMHHNLRNAMVKAINEVNGFAKKTSSQPTKPSSSSLRPGSAAKQSRKQSSG